MIDDRSPSCRSPSAVVGSVGLAAGVLDGGGEEIGVREELDAVPARHLSESLRVQILGEQDAVTGEELNIADHGVAAFELRQNGRVLSPCRRADAVITPIHAVDATGGVGGGPVARASGWGRSRVRRVGGVLGVLQVGSCRSGVQCVDSAPAGAARSAGDPNV